MEAGIQNYYLRHIRVDTVQGVSCTSKMDMPFVVVRIASPHLYIRAHYISLHVYADLKMDVSQQCHFGFLLTGKSNFSTSKGNKTHLFHFHRFRKGQKHEGCEALEHLAEGVVTSLGEVSVRIMPLVTSQKAYFPSGMF